MLRPSLRLGRATWPLGPRRNVQLLLAAKTAMPSLEGLACLLQKLLAAISVRTPTPGRGLGCYEATRIDALIRKMTRIATLFDTVPKSSSFWHWKPGWSQRFSWRFSWANWADLGIDPTHPTPYKGLDDSTQSQPQAGFDTKIVAQPSQRRSLWYEITALYVHAAITIITK